MDNLHQRGHSKVKPSKKSSNHYENTFSTSNHHHHHHGMSEGVISDHSSIKPHTFKASDQNNLSSTYDCKDYSHHHHHKAHTNDFNDFNHDNDEEDSYDLDTFNSNLNSYNNFYVNNNEEYLLLKDNQIYDNIGMKRKPAKHYIKRSQQTLLHHSGKKDECGERKVEVQNKKKKEGFLKIFF